MIDTPSPTSASASASESAREAGFNATSTADARTAPKSVRWVGASAVAAAALLVCAALGTLAYSFYETYGPNRDEQFFSARVLQELGLSALPFVLASAALVTGAAVAVIALVRRPRRRARVLPLAGFSLLLTIAITITGAWLGTHEKQNGQARAASACSPEERTALASLGTPAADGQYGHGMSDGTCRGFLAISGNADAGLAALRARLTAEGWQPAPGQAEPATMYVRNGTKLSVTITNGGGKTDVTLSIP